MFSGVTVVTNSCAYLTAHEAAGASGTRRSARPRDREGATFIQNPGATRRGIAQVRALITRVREIARAI